MKAVLLAILVSGAFGVAAQATEMDLCSAESDAEDGSRATTSGEIVTLYDDGFQIGEPDGFCGMNVELKGKLSAKCKVGAIAVVTGTIDYFLDANDLVDATATCGGG